MWVQSALTLASVLIIQLPQQSVGEIQYRQNSYPYYYYYNYPDYKYRSVYVNPYTNYQYRYISPVTKYVEPVRSYLPTQSYVEPVRSYLPSRKYTETVSSYVPPKQYYNDDKVYVNDMYGRTTVLSSHEYRKYVENAAHYSNYMARYSAMAPSTVCTSSTCGSNAHCSMIGGRPVCSCLRGYMGDPLHHCTRAECLDNTECRGHQACKNQRCVDPCLDICGANANCETRNHIPVCSCPAGYTGDPFTHCRRFDPEELCHPSPCGANTNCEVVNGVPTCKCLVGYHGSPIAGCRHECETGSECGPNLACIDFKCQNPCLSQCGTNAECEGVRNNNAVCKCPKNYFGNPYATCQPECTTHSDCPQGKPACFYNSCKNPCEGVCGVGANCELKGITPVCSCPRDMTGDPFVRCRPFEKRDLCIPNPCGDNAQCQPGYDKYNEERPVCTCLPGYQGDPIRGCVRGECTEDSHCPDHQNCNNYRCENPCIGQCASNADCMARRHIAVCTCPPGYNGDALSNCYQVSGTAITRRFYRQVIEMEKNLEATASNSTIVSELKNDTEVPAVVQETDKKGAKV